MTKTVLFTLLATLLVFATGLGQESPTPGIPDPPAVSPSPPTEPAVSPTPTPAPSPVRSVRISFVPPPLEGTISLGIYDAGGKLVRVLHQQVTLDAFTIGADALQTKWDGKGDDGLDLPAGKYHARGYAVGAIQLESLGTAPPESVPAVTTEKVPVKLVANPLVKNDRPTIELSVGFDNTDSFLKTEDALPLFVISERPNIARIVLASTGEKSMDVWQDSGAGIEGFRLSKLDQMMAFDCGAFDLK
jgi:hypothetical protein